jgi:hypothetical protein
MSAIKRKLEEIQDLILLGNADEMTTVEWMPEHLRSSHDACGNSGSWLHNGSLRLRVEHSCANQLMQEEPDWCRKLD